MLQILKHKPHGSLSAAVLTLALPLLTASCGMIYDEDLPLCRNDVKIKFVYDRNMEFRDAFSKHVNSVDVWAFSRDGSLVWHGAQHGEALAATPFLLPADVPPGEYEFVSWCGLYDNAGYNLHTYTPASKQELFLTLASLNGPDGNVCDSPLPMVFNGGIEGVTVQSAETANIEQTITLSLVQDTKNIKVMLSGPTVEDANNYSAFITAENRRLDYDNLPSLPVTYTQWSNGTVAERSAQVFYNLATSRLMAGSATRLTVTDNNDNRRVIDIPLVDYLLKVKEDYEDYYKVKMDNQEFLDRENNYTLEFTLDDNGSFDFNSIIIINGWVIVPTQVENPK